MHTKLGRLAPAVLLCLFAATAAHADSPNFSTKESDPAAQASSSTTEQRNHVLGSVGLGGVAATNSVQGNSAGVVAQARIRINGRGVGGDDGKGLYDVRANATYNVISGGQSGASTTVALRGEAFAGYAVQDIRNSCSIYVGASGYLRGALATANNGAANSARLLIGPETGLACDVSGVLFELSPSVGLGAMTNATNSSDLGATNPTNVGGAAVMAGGVARVSVLDRVHASLRAGATISNAEISGGPTSNMSMVGADVDVRVTDNWSVGLNADGVKYATDPAHPNYVKDEGVASATVTAVF